MTFGKRLRAARLKMALTQEELGARVHDRGKAAVSHWELDKWHPSVDDLMLICQVLNVSADWLLFGEADRPPLHAMLDALTDDERDTVGKLLKTLTQKRPPDIP